MKPSLVPLLPLLVAMAPACVLSVEADVPEVEITQHGIRMPGVDVRKSLGDVTITSQFTFTSSNSAWAKRMNSEVVAHQVKVTSDKLPNLDFVRTASLIMADPQTEGRNTMIVDYQRPQDAPSSATLDVSPGEPVDVTQLWSTDKTTIELTMSGDMPAEDWFISLTMGLSGKITFKY
jgi:hypothetical protein